MEIRIEKLETGFLLALFSAAGGRHVRYRYFETGRELCDFLKTKTTKGKR